MRITNLQVMDLLAGLRQFDAPGKVLKLDATTRWNLSRNLRKLLKLAQDIEDVRGKLIEQYQPDKPDGKPAEFTAELQKLMKIEVEVPLHPVKLADLNLAENEVGLQALTALDSMIEE